MKNCFKKSIILLIIICITCLYTNTAFAEINNRMNISQFENKNNPIENSTGEISGTIIGGLRIIGATIAIIMLLVIAMKYMISSPGDRADIKKHAVAYVIGALILFGVPAILGVLVDIAEVVNSK